MPVGVLRRFPVPSVSLYTIISITFLGLALLWSHNTIVKEQIILTENATLSAADDELSTDFIQVNEDLKDPIPESKTDEETYKSELESLAKTNDKTRSKEQTIVRTDTTSILTVYMSEREKRLEAERRAANHFNVTEIAQSILDGECSHFNGMLRLMWNEPLCLVLYVNAAYCLLTLVVQFIQKIVFGQLRAIERQHMKEKFWNFVFYKFIFVFGVMNVQSLNQVLVWVSWFTAIVFLLLLTKLCKDRFEFLSFSPNTPKCFHLKVCCLLAVIWVCSVLLGMSCIMYTSSIQSFSSDQLDNHAFAFMFTECVIIGIKATHVMMRYGIHLKDVQYEELWEQKATLVYHVDLVMELFCLTVNFFHHLHMLLSGNVWLSMASLVICMQLRYIFSEIQKRFLRHKNYRRVVANMEAQFPEATQEELTANEDQCAICWDQMETARRLPCGHLFHAPCLRSWLEQDTTCPTCRKQLDIRSNSRQDRQNNNIAPEEGNGLNENAEIPNANPMEEGDGHRHNHLWHFDGSRFASWLPSFYVEVMPPHTSRDTAGVATISRNATVGFHLDAMTREVNEVFPQIPAYLIRNDLRRTLSVEATTENILEGRIAPLAPEPVVRNRMRLNILNPGAVERLRNNLFSGAGLRRRLVLPANPAEDQLDSSNQSPSIVATSGGDAAGDISPSISESTIAAQQPPPLPSTSSLLSTNNRWHDHSNSHDGPPPPDLLTTPVHFSKAPVERQRTLRARQESMIRNARLKYLSAHQKKEAEMGDDPAPPVEKRAEESSSSSSSSFPLARFNTNVSGGILDAAELLLPTSQMVDDDDDSDLTDESLG